MSTPAQLPLQIRLGIRDSFNSPTAPFKTVLAKLNSEVGYDFSIVLPWVDIHRDLAKCFPDKTVLVPSVTSALTAYLDRIIALLEEQKFQDAFLEKMSSVYSRDIVIRVGESDQDTSCLDRNGKLTLSLPATGPQWYRTRLSGIGHDLEDVFLKSADITDDLPATRTKTTPSPAAAIADWVDVGSTKSKVSNITCLPSIHSLGKPETLFKSLLPYYVIVSGTGHNLHIESSHQPTLALVHAYFKKHTRKNMNLTTQEPYLHVSLKTSNWGSQMDEISIQLSDDRSASWASSSGISLVLSFLVSVCGYELEKSERGWYFLKRETPYENC